jgi:hypothetical protein
MTVEAIDTFDFAAEMNIQPPVSTKLRLGVEAALLVNKLADDVDVGLKKACSAYLADLGVKASPATSSEACGALTRSIVSARSKLGPGVSVMVDVAPPTCGASPDVLSDCALKCDPTLAAAGPAAKATCEAGRAQGTCDGLCAGMFDSTTANKCSGTCGGACDAKMKGTCSGVCTGKCDGKQTKKGRTPCAGICEGTCDAAIEGVCSGNCAGNCTFAPSAACAGTCSGSCSTEMKALTCTGDLTSPKIPDDCKAKCDALVGSSVSCLPGLVVVRVVGAIDPDAAQAFKVAAEKNLPALAKTAIGLADRSPKLIAEVKDAVDGVDTAVKASMTSVAVGSQVSACFGKPFADVARAGASLQGNIDLAVSVKASLESGGAGAHATFIAKGP